MGAEKRVETLPTPNPVTIEPKEFALDQRFERGLLNNSTLKLERGLANVLVGLLQKAVMLESLVLIVILDAVKGISPNKYGPALIALDEKTSLYRLDV